MSDSTSFSSHLVIACGGTGGHLFPGVAVGGEWLLRGGEVTLVVSEKEIDQVALQGESRFRVARLPALGSGQGSWFRLLSGLWASGARCRSMFRERPPQAVLAMGGFTSLAPILAGRRVGAGLFLHDSNAIPGRANRWLSLLTDEAFVGFEQAGRRLRTAQVHRTGTPVRPEFVRPVSASPARLALGLDPSGPVLLVMGGSQGAHGVNEAVLKSLPALLAAWPDLQFLHLTGKADFAAVNSRYQEFSAKAVVLPYLAEMHLALAAADLAVSRAGGSSLAEFAAMQLPAVLIPLPTAADDHQTANAQAVSAARAGIWLPQRQALDGRLAEVVLSLGRDSQRLMQMKTRLAEMHVADAARRIADRMAAHLQLSAPRGAAGGSSSRPAATVFCAPS
jgi:UDP-N-acetylglucosamine--N-acetylmuramyl-(pentapeptide) pyrophosphoryl-undecaprenol N-acetylglucosamine transferase